MTKERPLHLAARSGHSEVVQLLIQCPLHNNSRVPNAYGKFPIQLAAFHGHWGVAKILLGHEEIPNFQGGPGTLLQKLHTPLEILKQLLEHPDFYDVNGYDREWRQNEGILHAAIRKDAFECIQILSCHEKIDVNMSLDRPVTPLTLAAALGRTEAVELLLQHKNIDVNKTDYYDKTALQIARKKGHGEIVDVLLAHGAKDTDITMPSSGSISAIFNTANTVLPEMEYPTDLDFEEHSYYSLDKDMGDTFNDEDEEME